MGKIFEKLNNGFWLLGRCIYIQSTKSLVVKPIIKKDWTALYESGVEKYFEKMYGCWNGYSVWMFKKYFFIGIRSNNSWKLK